MQTIFSSGFYADVSSARELFLAKDAGATKFLFSGPGKTKKELLEALTANVDIVINIDSFSELTRLNQVCKEAKIQKCNAGIRVTFDEHQEWGKFGVPLSRLTEFCNLLSRHDCVSLIGIQFHMSWNKDASTFKVAIKKLSEVLSSKEMSPYTQNIQFIDMGGGFRPYQSEGYFPEDTPLGCIKKGLAELTESDLKFDHPYFILDSIPIEQYASEIGQAVDTYLRPIKDFEYFTEPGRILVNSALHVLVSVVDVKSDTCVITDGGTNIVGFERFEFDYFPIVNITNPSLNEREVSVYGALCMPQDYWGLRIFSDKIAEGDLIVIPYQGALTYSTMSDFIKGKATVYEMP
jgi:diaminopimelate decarboxylase